MMLAARLPHVGDRVLGAQEHAIEVDRDDTVPFLQRDLVGGLVYSGDARVVDQDVQVAERVRHLREDALDGLFVGGVELPVLRLAAALLDLIRRFEAGLRLDVGDRDLCPFSCEQTGGRAANPVRSSGDHRNLAVYPAHLSIPSEPSHSAPWTARSGSLASTACPTRPSPVIGAKL